MIIKGMVVICGFVINVILIIGKRVISVNGVVKIDEPSRGT